jgi:Chaperone of endosialidase
MCSDSPDTSGMNAAALANAEIAKDALAWYKQVYSENAPARKKAAEYAYKVADRQLASSELNDSISKDYWDYQKGTFRPLEQGIVTDAQNYDTAARREAKADQATADVGMQVALAQQAQNRDLARKGVMPGSGKMLAMSNQMALGEAAAKAGAANKAREQVELQGYARKMDAANLGRNLASNQATSAGVALNAGNSAVNNAGVPLVQSNAAVQTAGQGFNTAIQGNNSAGNLYGQAAQLESQDSGIWGALGTVAGGWAAGGFKMPTSDKNAKKNVKPVSDEQALDAVKSTPVSSWDYKPGQGDGGSHVGPMAQHVQKTMGEQAAPGGKQIDLITMNGMNMAATAALARKVDKLAKKVDGEQA